MAPPVISLFSLEDVHLFICQQTHTLDFESTPINICSPLSLVEVAVRPLVAHSNTFPLMFFPIVYCLVLPLTL